MKAGGYSPSARHRDWSTPFVDRCLDLLSVPGTDVPLSRVGEALVSDTGVSVPIVDRIPQFTECTTTGRRSRRLARQAARVARRARGALSA
jgi:hypothetical protein